MGRTAGMPEWRIGTPSLCVVSVKSVEVDSIRRVALHWAFVEAFDLKSVALLS